MNECKTEIRDGMSIDWDVPITMDDGLVLRAIFDNHVTLHMGPKHPAWVMPPIIPLDRR